MSCLFDMCLFRYVVAITILLTTYVSYSNNNRHMLLHAAEQLRKAAMVTPQQPIPKYAQAVHLVDATRLLLGHFDGYMSSVPKMRQVS